MVYAPLIMLYLYLPVSPRHPFFGHRTFLLRRKWVFILVIEWMQTARICVCVVTGILGSQGEFKRQFEAPIITARDKNASVRQIDFAKRRAMVMTHLLKPIVLRRDSAYLRCVCARGYP